jgi:hypothetical protein
VITVGLSGAPLQLANTAHRPSRSELAGSRNATHAALAKGCSGWVVGG